jgi:hypothetical protein
VWLNIDEVNVTERGGGGIERRMGVKKYAYRKLIENQ